MIEHRLSLGRRIGAAITCAALLLFLVGAYGLGARVFAQSSTRLEGQVFNGTASSLPGRAANLDVTMFQMGASGPVTQTTRTDDQGRFAFGDLKLDPNSPYFAHITYEGINYFSDILTPGTETSKPLTLTVYETQTVPADFQIDSAHFILDIAQNTLSGIELVQVKNTTDRAFVLPLPVIQNLSDLQFNDPRDQSRAIQGADGSLAFPILPTTDQILLGVQVKSSPSESTVRVNVPVRIGRMNVLVSQTGGVQVSSPQLSPGTVFTPQNGNSYWQLNGAGIAAGSTVSVLISNLPGGDNTALVRIVVLGAGGIFSVALLALPFVRRRRSGSEQPPLPLPSGRYPEQLSEIEETGRHLVGERLSRLEALADLDDSFEAGDIPEAEYQIQRAALKAELMHDPDIQA